MDPTHFLCSQSVKHHHDDKARRAEIDAFYEHHGLELFAAMSRWHARLSAAWLRIRNRRNRSDRFVPGAQKV